MICVSDFEIGLIGSCFMLGIVFGCITIARLGDIYGRRPIFILGMMLQIIGIFGIIVSSNLYLAYFYTLLLGLSITGKLYVGFTYLQENQPKHK